MSSTSRPPEAELNTGIESIVLMLNIDEIRDYEIKEGSEAALAIKKLTTRLSVKHGYIENCVLEELPNSIEWNKFEWSVRLPPQGDDSV